MRNTKTMLVILALPFACSPNGEGPASATDDTDGDTIATITGTTDNTDGGITTDKVSTSTGPSATTGDASTGADETTGETTGEPTNWCDVDPRVDCNPSDAEDWCDDAIDLFTPFMQQIYLDIIRIQCDENYSPCNVCWYAWWGCVQANGGDACYGLEGECRCLAAAKGAL